MGGVALIVLVTWNVQHGRSPGGTVDVSAMADACAGFDADVLALQELDRNARRSGDVDQIAVIGDVTGMAWAFGEAIPGYGNALLARGGLDDVEVLSLPHDPRREPRCAVIARAAGVSVACCHLGLHGDARSQLPVVVAALRRRPPPHALLGDLNLETVDVAPLTLVGGAPTFPAHRPRRRIDHVAVDGLTVEDAAVLPQQAVADHRPVRVGVH